LPLGPVDRLGVPAEPELEPPVVELRQPDGLVGVERPKLLLRRGDAKVAAEYLTRAATGSEPNDTLPAALAAVALRGVGKK
jgi:hypothetical protein